MYKFIKVSAILLLALLAIGLAVFIFFPTSKYAAENARAADAVKKGSSEPELIRKPEYQPFRGPHSESGRFLRGS